MNILYDQIILFGDSITQFSYEIKHIGWGSSLADAYQRRADVLNRGFGGYTSKWAVPILNQMLPHTVDESQRARIRLITLFFGANDSAKVGTFQHVPIDEYANNLSKMIERINQYSTDTRVIVITTPPVNEDQWHEASEQGGPDLRRSNKVAKAYAEAAKDVARKYNVPYVDLWTEIMKLSIDPDNLEDKNDLTGTTKSGKRDLSEFMSDGLHLGTLGSAVLFAALMQTIKSNFPELNPETMPEELGWFWESDLAEYEKTLVFRK
ncbi:SGNH hydrolase-type esterase domain-containing protein [Umbelopsis sp. PMI_123]|nr:SGNH hydrolase-type esterase domain-containing protein [Umbelopsis sp. PMI_123]